MDCGDVEADLDSFLLGELASERLRAIQLHLRGCRRCRARARQARARADVVVPCNLVAFIHEQLPGHRRSLVAAHLDYCEECRAEYQDLRLAVNALSNNLSPYQLGRDFCQGVMREWRPHRPGRAARRVREGLAGMIDLAEAGNRLSYECLVESYCHYVYVCAYGRVGDFQVAARIAHELFARGLPAFSVGVDRAGLRAWLRARVRELAAADDWVRRSLPAGKGEDGLSGFHRSRKLVRHRRLLAFAAGLPAKERLPLLLFYVERLGYDDIGRVLELPWREVMDALAGGTRAAAVELKALKQAVAPERSA